MVYADTLEISENRVRSTVKAAQRFAFQESTIS